MQSLAVMKNWVHFESKPSSAKEGAMNFPSKGEGSEGCSKAPDLPTLCVTLGQSLQLSEPQFPYLKKGHGVPGLLTSQDSWKISISNVGRKARVDPRTCRSVRIVFNIM